MLNKRENGDGNPLQKAMDGWDQMESDLMTAVDELRECKATQAHLLAEVDYLRSQIGKVTTERDRYQRYSIEISTRLSGIKETIAVAELASREFAMKPPVPMPQEGVAVPAGELKQLEEIISRLPQNAYQSEP